MANRVESDDWAAGPSIFAPERLAAIRIACERGPIILEHRVYRGSTSPERKIFEEYDDVLAYLRESAKPGDAIWVWSYTDACPGNKAVTHAKVPDSDGSVPSKGAY